MASLNTDDKLAMAVTADQYVLRNTGNYSLTNAKMDVVIKSISDSILLRVEHHWAHPDPLKNSTIPYDLSSYRYWKVDGVFPQNLDASASIQFDGRNLTSGGNGNLDNDLTINGADSLVLLYRKDASYEWWEYQNYSKISFAGLTFGTMELDSLIHGEYTLANGFSAIGIKEEKITERDFEIFPNPVSGQLKIRDVSGDTSAKQVYMFSIEGKLMAKESMKDEGIYNVSKFSAGTYLIYVRQDKSQLFSGKFIVSE
jgi:aminopeptidase N